MFADPDVSHVDGDVSPERDIDTVATELILADLQTLERAAPRLAKESGPARMPNASAWPMPPPPRSACSTTGTPCTPGPPAAGIDAGRPGANCTC